MKHTFTRILALGTICCGLAGASNLLAQEPDAAPPPPVRVVVQFLQLSEPQVTALMETRREAEASLNQLHREILARKQRLAEILKAEEPSPPEAGVLVIQISRLERSVAEVHSSFIEGFAANLEPEQQGKLHAVVRARQLQGVLPAFAALGLIP